MLVENQISLRLMNPKRTDSGPRELAAKLLASVSEAGPLGCVALIACGSMALAGYAIWALVTVVRLFKG
jgi:hypothetical protein